MRPLPLVALVPTLGCLAPGTGTSPPPPVEPFGTTSDGVAVGLYALTNANGVVAKLTDFGATLVELHLPDREGRLADVVLGFDDVSGYQGTDNQYFGCTVGRVANRIAGGTFELGGRTHTLATNDGDNHLHGGAVGFGQRVWTAEPLETGNGQAVCFRYRSPDGEEGYPGTVTASVTYTLTDDDELVLDYVATTDATTPVNLTHHSYFNLGGHGTGTILDHELRVDASRYTPAGEGLIPTGVLASVVDTPLDFQRSRRIGARIEALTNTPARGYDHNLVLSRADGELRFACRLADPDSGRVLEIFTTEPGLQLYSGNFLFGQAGKGGATYTHRGGVCLEAQHFPDAVHHSTFPSIVLRPDRTYRQTTVHRFFTD